MTFLPILERELRVAARKRSTAWLRVVAALVALIIGSGFLTISLVTGMGTAQFGRGLFGTLTWLALATAIAAGLFFTADCLSEEKREGTLGFLFLTDLRGVDVVGGKLLATSLRGTYALLAIFPILAVTLLMGGVTGGQFWRCALAILNALFCSLATGLVVSSVSRDSQRALAGTFLVLLLLCVVGPLVDRILLSAVHFRAWLGFTSPAYAFWAATAWGRSGFWPALCLSHAVGWLALGLAGVLVRRTWQDRPSSLWGAAGRLGYSGAPGNAPTCQLKRQKLLEPNPVMWLASRSRWQSIGIWLLAGITLCCFGFGTLTLPTIVWIAWRPVSRFVVLSLYLWVASQAPRFFIEARRSGLLEVLLVTPLGGRDIVVGQWRAFRRSFGLPLLLLLLVQAAGALLAQHASFLAMSAAGQWGGSSWILEAFAAALDLMSTTANLVTLFWVGMWMGLTTKSASMAVLKTLLFVEVLPAMVIYFVSTILAAAVMLGGMFRSAATPSPGVLAAYPVLMTAVWAALTAAKDTVFFLWASNNLHKRFRLEASPRVKSGAWAGRGAPSPNPPPL